MQPPYARRLVVVERDARVRAMLRPHFSPVAERVHIVAEEAEAHELVRFSPSALVLARNAEGAAHAARVACGFELQAGPGAVRLVLLGAKDVALASARQLSAYLHDLDQCVAVSSLPPSRTGDEPARVEVAEDFPRDFFAPLARIGGMSGADIFLALNRITGRKELVVQVADDNESAFAAAEVMYAQLEGCSACGPLRHEITRHHSFFSSRSLPLDLAQRADALARRPVRRAPPALPRVAAAA